MGFDMSRKNAVITLLTDFGLQDEYVGVMKGVIASISPDTRIIDISHDIARHDIRHAALILRSAFRFFPKKAIHVVVVDPGVGTDRKILCVKHEGYYFIAPDNGVLGSVLENGHVEEIRCVTNDRYFLKPVGNTFHGRDILAPAAGHLAQGVAMSSFGKRLAKEEIKIPKIAVPTIFEDELTGEIIWTDRFGNLVTNVDRRMYDRFLKDKRSPSVIILVGDTQIRGVAASYGDADVGAPVALFGSRDLLEISVNQDDAAAYFGVSVGRPFRIKADPDRR
jgi:S-adenosyl-L-methionine hydrolase (adenosine-forming)